MRPTLLGLLRAAYIVVAALLSSTLLTRLGVPPAWVPDLVLIGVVATAVRRGALHGALVGLAAGWVVELVPPVGSPLGIGPLVMMLAGAAAGALHRVGSRSLVRPVAALVVSSVVMAVGRLAVAGMAEGSWSWRDAGGRLISTVAVGIVLLPVWSALDGALVRRRLG